MPASPPLPADRSPSAPQPDDARPQSFARNTELEALLAQINGYLRHAELAQLEPPPPEFPLILLMGAPRSGTTLFMQWLQATGRIAVPTNLISRFYAAPAFGVMLQRLLFEPRYRYRDEFDLPLAAAADFGSDLGKTRGTLGHNSFFFFWRQFFPISEPSRLPDEQVSAVDTTALRRAAWRFAEEAQVPLAMKAYLVQYHLRLLEATLDRVLFVHITRDPIAVMSSLLQVRRTLYGDEHRWWGCRPPGIEGLTSASPALQVAGQVALTDRSIRTELAAIPAHKQMIVSYEQLCDAPAEVWAALRDKLIEGSANPESAADGLAAEYSGPATFRRSGKALSDRARLDAAWTAVTSQ